MTREPMRDDPVPADDRASRGAGMPEGVGPPDNGATAHAVGRTHQAGATQEAGTSHDVAGYGRDAAGYGARGTDEDRPREARDDVAGQAGGLAQREAVPEASTGQAGAAGRGGPSDTRTRLICPDRGHEYQQRWAELKGAFVDAPRHAVQQIDELVGEVLDELQTTFHHQRAELGTGLAEHASTEELRIAFGRYREFFDRLLSY